MAKSKRTGKELLLNRRQLLGTLAALGLSPAEIISASKAPIHKNASPGKVTLANRINRAYQVRLKAAEFQRELSVSDHPTNGDESLYSSKIGSYSKGLPHDALNHVDPQAFQVFVEALNSGNPYDFERIPLGGYAKLSNPQAAFAYDLIGPDCCQISILPPPAFNSSEQAGEMCELYWNALALDVPFTEYETNKLIYTACEDLNRLSHFRGLKNPITPTNIFRAFSKSCLKGPYISQFLLRDIPLSPIRVLQKIRTALSGINYDTRYEDWLGIQNGKLAGVNEFDPRPRFIRNGRDLAEYVHRDFTYQAFICAALMLFNMGAIPDGGNPYRYSRTQSAFVTYGSPFAFQLLAAVTTAALKATWFQKWIVHRKLRPEEFAGRVHNHLEKKSDDPIHADLLNSTVLDSVYKQNHSYLLPLAYPEGCPLHPSYPAGHATIAGACVTVLKALFDESYVIPDPVVSSSDGLILVPYEGTGLTIGGELDKLAANIAIGRDFAGVHWRSDGIEGIKFGEEVAIRVLQEMKLTGNELFTGFSVTKFDGRKIVI